MFLFGLLSPGTTMGTSPITVNTNWGTTSAATVNVTSATRTLTVPVGNVGDVRLDVAFETGRPRSYKKNSSSFTTFTTGTVVNFSSGDTLSFRMSLSGSGDELNLNIVDNTTESLIGTCSLVNTS